MRGEIALHAERLVKKAMPWSLIGFDTDHIKSYVFGTNRLKEIRGASSILDTLNRTETRRIARKFGARAIYAHGGSALFLVDDRQDSKPGQAELFGRAVQRLYHEKTGGGASITYAIQSLPNDDEHKEDILKATQLDENTTMADMLKLLRLRLRQAKDSLALDMGANEHPVQHETNIALPSHALLSPCESCGIAYAQDLWKDPDDLDEEEGRYCRVCLSKRDEDRKVKNQLRTARKATLSDETLWGRIIRSLDEGYLPTTSRLPQRPKDFNTFREFTRGKEYLGLIYADANNMGKALEDLKTLEEVQNFAERIDNAVFKAMSITISAHLPLQKDVFPFDVLLVGGDDIVLVVPADKALQVAYTLADQFHQLTGTHTLSTGVVIAPVKYPFGLQHTLVEETLKAAKKATAQQTEPDQNALNTKQSLINFVVVTGNTSLNYQKQYAAMHRKSTPGSKHEFYATMRPYTLHDLDWLLTQLRLGSQKRLGRTKLNQLREAILKLNQTTTILEALALLRNWKEDERAFIKDMVQRFDTRLTTRQQQMGTLFPWALDGERSNANLTMYRTPLLDFIEMYDFIS